MTTSILIGDCRETLRTLPAESVHCVVTSPPYWGLRDYGLPPLLWGGEASCEHEWGDESTKTTQPNRDTSGGFSGRDQGTRGKQGHSSSVGFTASQGSFCLRCGAWRGSLGLEPTVGLYVRHLVEVMREVKRVLRDDGTCWLNLGSSYISKRIESDEMVLRDDLTNQEKAYVLYELGEHLGSKSETMP